MPHFFFPIQDYMDVVFFIYGLSFIAMALVILAQPREESRYELANLVWLLAVFGIIHGILEWMDLWTIVRGAPLKLWKTIFLFLSFGFLFEFGRRLMRAVCKKMPSCPNFIGMLLGKPIYSLVALGFLVEFLMIPDWMLATQIASRYFLGFTGSALAGLGFLLFFKIAMNNGQDQRSPWQKKYFILAAIAFLFYGFMGGLVVPEADVFPANKVNYPWFLSTFQFPVQLFRAACAVMAAFAVGNILRIFHAEGRQKIQTALALADERSRDLEQSEAQLRDIAAAMGEALYVIDGKGRITFTNHEAQVLLGWTEEELMDQDAHRLFHFKKANNEPYPSEDCEIRKVVHSGQTYRSEEEVFWRKDGSRLDVAVCSKPLIREGKIVSSVTAFSDITERKKAESALKAAKGYAENLINTANAMVVELDVEGKVKVFNPAAEMITGYTLAELKGRNWFETIVPRDRYPEVWAMFERLPAGELLKRFENSILTKSGEERHIVWQNSEVRENDQIVGLVTFGIDITERKRAEEALREQKEFLNAILESEPECVKVLSADGKLLQMNQAGLAMLEVDSIEEAQHEGLTGFILPEYHDAFSALSGRVFQGEPGTLKFPVKGARGTLRWLETHATPLRDAKGGVAALVGVTRDITERKRVEEALRESEEKFRLISTSAKDVIVIIGLDEEIIYWNPAAESTFGYKADEVMGQNLHHLLAPSRHHDAARRGFEHFRMSGEGALIGKTMETTALRRNGEEFPIELSISAMRMDGRWQALGIIRDITERKKTEEKIRQLAYYDALTDLPNRRMLLDRLNQALAQAKRYQRAVAVMFLDLDRFKLINDTLGHDIGDELLKEVATRLNACVRSGDTVARQGGDEFVIVLAEVAHSQDAALVAEKIISTLGQPIFVNSHELQVTTSIGIALFPVNGTDDAQELMRKADAAMYAAKEAGRNGYRFC
jgi:diguanylate cyclase (GGDEF)-like protein/PAS domain S-box-containing protein